ncbi:MAG: histidine phosphatase family protein, partial [Actinomycetota bacterium]|nr:histidine phosphatase family protein [Actinomycetota bacterium]
MGRLPGHPVRRRGRRPGHRPRGAGRGRVLTAARRLVLLRHGRTGHNAEGLIQGHLDVPLDDVGRAQADAVAEALAPARPAVVVSSDLSRARETAVRVAERARVPLRLDARLREVHLGAWQGLTTEQVRERFPEEHAAWRAGRDVARGSGERYA